MYEKKDKFSSKVAPYINNITKVHGIKNTVREGPTSI